MTLTELGTEVLPLLENLLSAKATAFPAMMARMRALLGTCSTGPCL